MDQPNGRVDYLHEELRDLRAYITTRFDALDERLRAKADASDVEALSSRVAAIEATHLRWSGPRMAGGALVLSMLSALGGLIIARLFGH